MEPSLARYVLRQSWRQQIALVVLALVSFPFLYLFYELPKTIVNHAITPDGAEFPVSLFGLEFGQRGYLLALCAGLLALVPPIPGADLSHADQGRGPLAHAVLPGR